MPSAVTCYAALAEVDKPGRAHTHRFAARCQMRALEPLLADAAADAARPTRRIQLPWGKTIEVAR